MVADGEGARRIARVHRARRRRRRRVEAVARAVANSPLVKAALHGGDPNWGRIVAGGRRGAARAPRRCAVDIAIEGITVCSRRRRRSLRRGRARAARSPATRSSTRSTCPGEGAETEVFFSDLSHEYVTINAEYTT